MSDYDEENYKHYKLAANVLALTIVNLGSPIAFTEEALVSLRGKALRIAWNEEGEYFVAEVIDLEPQSINTWAIGGDA